MVWERQAYVGKESYRAVSSTGAAVGLATLSVVKGLTTEGTLVDLTLLSAREWKTVVFELEDSGRGLKFK